MPDFFLISGLFLANVNLETFAVSTSLIALIAILVAVIVMVNFTLWPHSGPMRIPVSVYSLVIGLMALSAWIGNASPVVLSGVLLFIISDIVLSREKFIPDQRYWWDRNSAPIIWWLYIGGQLLIAIGMLLQ